MKYGVCILLAYLMGSLSPSALIAKIKHKNLKQEGTGNLGATNTTLVFGKMFGFLVMLLDIFKGFLTVKLTLCILPEVEWFAILAGFAAVIGHCFPFYLHFKGGKGLATFGGVFLAYDPWLFLLVVTTGIAAVLLTNSATSLSYYAALFVPIYVTVTNPGIPLLTVCVAMSLFMMVMFLPNLKKAIRGQEPKSRDFLKKQFRKSSGSPGK